MRRLRLDLFVWLVLAISPGDGDREWGKGTDLGGGVRAVNPRHAIQGRETSARRRIVHHVLSSRTRIQIPTPANRISGHRAGCAARYTQPAPVPAPFYSAMKSTYQSQAHYQAPKAMQLQMCYTLNSPQRGQFPQLGRFDGAKEEQEPILAVIDLSRRAGYLLSKQPFLFLFSSRIVTSLLVL